VPIVSLLQLQRWATSQNRLVPRGGVSFVRQREAPFSVLLVIGITVLIDLLVKEDLFCNIHSNNPEQIPKLSTGRPADTQRVWRKLKAIPLFGGLLQTVCNDFPGGIIAGFFVNIYDSTIVRGAKDSSKSKSSVVKVSF
jgi:hypothetical protein